MRAPPAFAPTVAEWTEVLRQPGAQGGLSTEPVEYEGYEKREVDEVQEGHVVTQYHIEAARDDYKFMVGALRKCHKRKAAPTLGVPAEALLIAMAPHRVRQPGVRGLGYSDEFHAPVFRRRCLRMLTLVRSSGRTPLAWSRARSYSLDKRNGKAGVLGLRLIHSFDATALAWFRAQERYRRAPMQWDWAHGSVRGRSRLSPLIVQMAMGWRAQQLGRSAVLTLYDARNAFACCDIERISGQMYEQYPPAIGWVRRKSYKRAFFLGCGRK